MLSRYYSGEEFNRWCKWHEWGRGEVQTGFFGGGNLREKDHLEGLGIDGNIILPYLPARKTHCDFSLEILEKNYACILILVIYWKKTGLLHTKISKHNIIYSS